MSDQKLLEPISWGSLTLKNRVVMAPMTRARAGVQRLPNDRMARYYAIRSSAGLLITEATVISSQANGWNQSPGIYTPEMVQGWREVVDAVHQAGGTIFLQLWHCGRASHSSFFEDGSLPVAPSAIKIQGEGIHTPNGKQPYETPRALQTRELPGIVEDYRKAAQHAKQAGFDGVEIHSANGYLLDSFLQSKTNHRTDAYGGSIANRYRLLNEVVEATASVWDRDRIGVRLSPNGMFNDMGSSDYRDTFLYVAEQLDGHALGYLHVMDGLAFGFHQLGDPLTLEDFRGVYRGRLIGNCGYEQSTAEAALQRNAADMIAFGRPYISNPDLVARFANGWPLNPPAEVSTWYSFGEEGYLDYPTHA
jgi:N-ethylmaleimide reductase